MAVNVGVNVWMYASPVVYPLQTIPEGTMKIIIKLNPVSEVIELIRWIMLGRGSFELSYYLYGLLETISLLLLSMVIFNRVERTFIDTV